MGWEDLLRLCLFTLEGYALLYSRYGLDISYRVVANGFIQLFF